MFGYGATYMYFQRQEVRVPNVIGKDVCQALMLAQKSRLGLRLVAQREDTTVPEGTILDQIPRPALSARINQTIFLTLSKQPALEQVPDFWGQEHKQIRSYARKNDVSLTVFYVYSKYPQDTCIAQCPLPGGVLSNKAITICISLGSLPMYVVPDVRKSTVEDVEAALTRFGVRFERIHTEPIEAEHTCQHCLVDEQFPAPGSIVDLSKGVFMQLQVKK